MLPPLREHAIEHNNYLKSLLDTGLFPSGEPLDDRRRQVFQKDVDTFDPADYPETIPVEIAEMQCRWFGHICPVVFSAEGFTETTEKRRTGRSIPPRILMRVARRDNYMCQECGTPLRDDEIEFDHIIPVSKGGSSEEHNLRVSCFDCNRSKSNKVSI